MYSGNGNQLPKRRVIRFQEITVKECSQNRLLKKNPRIGPGISIIK
jgi:hypothetical protein